MPINVIHTKLCHYVVRKLHELNKLNYKKKLRKLTLTFLKQNIYFRKPLSYYTSIF